LSNRFSRSRMNRAVSVSPLYTFAVGRYAQGQPSLPSLCFVTDVNFFPFRVVSLKKLQSVGRSEVFQPSEASPGAHYCKRVALVMIQLLERGQTGSCDA
jgi:hypothetical protein